MWSRHAIAIRMLDCFERRRNKNKKEEAGQNVNEENNLDAASLLSHHQYNIATKTDASLRINEFHHLCSRVRVVAYSSLLSFPLYMYRFDKDKNHLPLTLLHNCLSYSYSRHTTLWESTMSQWKMLIYRRHFSTSILCHTHFTFRISVHILDVYCRKHCLKYAPYALMPMQYSIVTQIKSMTHSGTFDEYKYKQ